MKKFLIFCLFVFACVSLEAKSYYSFKSEQSKTNFCIPFMSSLLSNYAFEGDKEGLFVGNIVAVLEDGSHWKVHPDHTEIFGQWQPGEIVHIDIRTSWYFFKREHKFALVNHNRNEIVSVMMINSPWQIEIAEDPVPSAYMTVNGLPTSAGLDFKVNLVLNDGEEWEIDVGLLDMKNKKRFSLSRQYEDKYFRPQTPVYVGYHEENDNIYFFIINGTQKEAKWRWARKGNYKYEW